MVNDGVLGVALGVENLGIRMAAKGMQFPRFSSTSANRHRGPIATGALSSPRGVLFGDLSILTVPSRHADIYGINDGESFREVASDFEGRGLIRIFKIKKCNQGENP